MGPIRISQLNPQIKLPPALRRPNEEAVPFLAFAMVPWILKAGSRIYQRGGPPRSIITPPLGSCQPLLPQAPGTHSPTLLTAPFGPHLPPHAPPRIKALLRANSESLLSAPAWHRAAAGRYGGRPRPCLPVVWLGGLYLPPPVLGAWEVWHPGPSAGLGYGVLSLVPTSNLAAPCSAAPLKPLLARPWACVAPGTSAHCTHLWGLHTL